MAVLNKLYLLLHLSDAVPKNNLMLYFLVNNVYSQFSTNMTCLEQEDGIKASSLKKRFNFKGRLMINYAFAMKIPSGQHRQHFCPSEHFSGQETSTSKFSLICGVYSQNS